MADTKTNTFNMRVQLKYDTLANWSNNNPTLLAGEVALVTLGASATTGTATTPDNGTHPVLMKVGPGNFNSLPFTSALAADVYGWAKENELKFSKAGTGNDFYRDVKKEENDSTKEFLYNEILKLID